MTYLNKKSPAGIVHSEMEYFNKLLREWQNTKKNPNLLVKHWNEASVLFLIHIFLKQTAATEIFCL